MSQYSCITFLFLIEHIKCEFTMGLVSCKSALLFSFGSELLIPNTEAERWFAGLGPPERIVPIIPMTWKGNVTESPESLPDTSHCPITQRSQSLRVLIIKEKKKKIEFPFGFSELQLQKTSGICWNNCRQVPNGVLCFVRSILGKQPPMRCSHRATPFPLLLSQTLGHPWQHKELGLSAGLEEHTHHHSWVILKNFNTNLI